MHTPPLLLAAALLFWGWQTDLLIISVMIAIFLEGSRLAPWRWDISVSEFKHISNLCTILFIVVIIYLNFSMVTGRVFLTAIQRLPLILFPLIVSQVYSLRKKVDISALFLTVRIRQRKKTDTTIKNKAIDLTYPYFAVCIFAVSAANIRNLWFYSGVFILTAWILLYLRSRRYTIYLCAFLLLLCGSMGYIGHRGLSQLQLIMEKKGISWLSSFLNQEFNPFETRTAIGEMGRLKLSSRVIMRVESEYPLLLRKAVYNTYDNGTWFCWGKVTWREVKPKYDGLTWLLGDKLFHKESNSIKVYAYLNRGRGILSLPHGVFEITNLPVGKMELSSFMVVMVGKGPGLIHYKVKFSPDALIDSVPDKLDLNIPEAEEPAISVIAEDLGILSQPPDKVLKTLHTFFLKNFKYSLTQKRRGVKHGFLKDFLINTRSGHCEYFATAAVLLLRKAGVPSRYITGYAVNERSGNKNVFLVRGRHAHAWTLAHVDGKWQYFDTTPPNWGEIARQEDSVWEAFYDVWDQVIFLFYKWRWGERKDISSYMGLLLVPLILFLVWRIFFGKSPVSIEKKGKGPKKDANLLPGKDSEFYKVMEYLKSEGLGRHSWEPLFQWIERIEKNKNFHISVDKIKEIVSLHYRYRFDPDGITQKEKKSLQFLVQNWVNDYENNLQ